MKYSILLYFICFLYGSTSTISYSSDIMVKDVIDSDVNLPPQTPPIVYSREENESSLNLNQAVHNEICYNPDKNVYYRNFNSLEAAEQYNKLLGQQAQEKIIGLDDRREVLGKKVQNPTWSCHFYLELSYTSIQPTGKSRTYYASGTLVNPSVLLTAAHNLYDDNDGGYPDRIDCFAACYDTTVLAEASVFPKIKPSSVFIPQTYLKNKDKSADIGLIIFDQETAKLFKEKITFATPLKNFTKLPRERITFYVTGYPGKRVAYSMGGKILEDAQNNMVKYDIDTEPGQSGSGIWFKSKDKIYCVGTHAYAGKKKDIAKNIKEESFNLGVLITHQIATEIERNKLH